MHAMDMQVQDLNNYFKNLLKTKKRCDDGYDGLQHFEDSSLLSANHFHQIPLKSPKQYLEENIVLIPGEGNPVGDTSKLPGSTGYI